MSAQFVEELPTHQTVLTDGGDLLRFPKDGTHTDDFHDMVRQLPAAAAPMSVTQPATQAPEATPLEETPPEQPTLTAPPAQQPTPVPPPQPASGLTHLNQVAEAGINTAGQAADLAADGYRQQAVAIDAKANLESEAAAKQAAELAGRNARMAEVDAKQADRNAYVDTYMNKQLSQIQDMQARASSMQIDPNHFWNSKGALSKVGAGIAMALSGLSGHQNNLALETINHGIEQDLANQKDQIGLARQQVGDQMNFYKFAGQHFADETQRKEASKLMLQQATQRKIEQMLAGTNSQVAKVNGQQLLGQLNVEMAKTHQALVQAGLGVAQQSYAHVESAEARDKAMQANAAAEQAKLAAAGNPADALTVPGLVGNARDARSARAVEANEAASTSALEAAQKIKVLRDKYGSETLPSEARSEMLAQQALLHSALQGMGFTQEQANQVAPKPDAYGTSVGYSYNALPGLIRVQQHNFNKARGFYARTSKGPLSPGVSHGGEGAVAESEGAQ